MRKLMCDKRGVSTALIAIMMIVVLAAGVGVWGLTQSQVGGDVAAAVAAGGCENEPYITLVALNEYAKGTTVTVTGNYEVDGVYMGTFTSGTTNFAKGASGTLIIGAPNYINKTVPFENLDCGNNPITTDILATSAVTLSVLDQDLTALTNSEIGGASNISESANPVNFIVRLDGTVDESTGELLITIEANDTQVDEMSITARSGEVIESDGDVYNGLKLFAAEKTSPSIKQAFVVAAIEDGAQNEYLIKMTPESGETIGGGTLTGAVYVNVYSAQAYVDSDGSFKVGWEDSDGNAMYEDKATDFDFLVE